MQTKAPKIRSVPWRSLLPLLKWFGIKWWSYKLCLKDRLLFLHRYCSIHGEGGVKRDLHVPHVFWGWRSLLWWRTHLLSDLTALRMQCHSLIQQRSHTSKKILLRQWFQGLKGNPRKMAVTGEMKSQMEDGGKARRDGTRREKRRRKLQKENK